MAGKKNKPAQGNEASSHSEKKQVLTRRGVLKSLAGIPVLGVFAYGLLEKQSYDHQKKQNVLNELGLDDIKRPGIIKNTAGKKGSLLRVGIVGFGSRANALSRGMGFMHPKDIEFSRKRGTLDNWLAQENLNIAVTGICDVFDLHAQKGLETVRGGLYPGGGPDTTLEVKRFRHYHEMLESKDIDAVVIATPEHHHAQMTIDAVHAGKHVYCEKSFTRTEEELYAAYDTVKNSKIVFQLGHQIAKNIVFKHARKIIKKDILGKITLIEATTNRNTAHGAWIRHLDKQGNPKPGDKKSIDWAQWLGSRPYVPFSIDRYYNWTKWFDYSTGLLGQLFTHEFDAVNQLLHIGIPESVVSSGGIYYWKDNREIPDVLQSVFEYPERELTLVYSANLANSRQRGRVFMGHDASMELGGSLSVTADINSTRYKDKIAKGIIDPSYPMFSYNPLSGGIDAVSSATEKYYASRGLTDTFINGKRTDVTHLHIKDWVDCIRNGGTPGANIDLAFEEGVTVLMAHKSYIEKRRVKWDPVKRKIV